MSQTGTNRRFNCRPERQRPASGHWPERRRVCSELLMRPVFVWPWCRLLLPCVSGVCGACWHCVGAKGWLTAVSMRHLTFVLKEFLEGSFRFKLIATNCEKLIFEDVLVGRPPESQRCKSSVGDPSVDSSSREVVFFCCCCCQSVCRETSGD